MENNKHLADHITIVSINLFIRIKNKKLYVPYFEAEGVISGIFYLVAGDCGQTGYFASGSAYSSQVLLPDGTVVTNSKGNSVSSDGVQRTFHELKQEADKYVSNSDPKTTYISRLYTTQFSSNNFQRNPVSR